jgi:DEAD/DEAH box helicase domain-containing protein
VDVDHYTQAELAVTLKPLEVFDSAALPAGSRVHGEVMVSTLATLYKKLKLDTHENLGWGRIHLPECELHTTAWWLAFDPLGLAGWRRDELDVALVGAGRALQTVASILLMSDPHDLGMVAQVRSPHAERPVIYLWEAVPGGVGLAPRLFERTDDLLERALGLVEDCTCEAGCPACVGPRGETGGDGRALAVRLLRHAVGPVASGIPAPIAVAAQPGAAVA